MAITANINDITTLTHLIGLSDQLDATVTEVWGAWSAFVNGPLPAGGMATAQPVGGDRFETANNTLNRNIGSLVELAASIQART